jgi:hypothetical protein
MIFYCFFCYCYGFINLHVSITCQLTFWYRSELKEMFDISDTTEIAKRVFLSVIPNATHTTIMIQPDLYGPVLCVMTLPLVNLLLIIASYLCGLVSYNHFMVLHNIIIGCSGPCLIDRRRTCCVLWLFQNTITGAGTYNCILDGMYVKYEYVICDSCDLDGSSVNIMKHFKSSCRFLFCAIFIAIMYCYYRRQ